jgi:hypothetical protein
MFNALIYKVFRRGHVAMVNMFLSVDLVDNVEEILHEQYKFGTCRLEFVCALNFEDHSVFDCVIEYLNLVVCDETILNSYNEKILYVLGLLKNSEAKRHLEKGLKNWIVYLSSKGSNIECIKLRYEILSFLSAARTLSPAP